MYPPEYPFAKAGSGAAGVKHQGRTTNAAGGIVTADGPREAERRTASVPISARPPPLGPPGGDHPRGSSPHRASIAGATLFKIQKRRSLLRRRFVLHLLGRPALPADKPRFEACPSKNIPKRFRGSGPYISGRSFDWPDNKWQDQYWKSTDAGRRSASQGAGFDDSETPRVQFARDGVGGGPLVPKMPNDFSPNLAVSHRFVLLDNFQHCASGDRVMHEVCLRLRSLGLEPPIFGPQSLRSLRHSKHSKRLFQCNGAGHQFVAMRILPSCRHRFVISSRPASVRQTLSPRSRIQPRSTAIAMASFVSSLGLVGNTHHSPLRVPRGIRLP
jgi:hypothetical protein